MFVGLKRRLACGTFSVATACVAGLLAAETTTSVTEIAAISTKDARGLASGLASGLTGGLASGLTGGLASGLTGGLASGLARKTTTST
jgi:predicted lipid-binding transport protein (Tim44 family)